MMSFREVKDERREFHLGLEHGVSIGYYNWTQFETPIAIEERCNERKVGLNETFSLDLLTLTATTTHSPTHIYHCVLSPVSHTLSP